MSVGKKDACVCCRWIKSCSGSYEAHQLRTVGSDCYYVLCFAAEFRETWGNSEAHKPNSPKSCAKLWRLQSQPTPCCQDQAQVPAWFAGWYQGKNISTSVIWWTVLWWTDRVKPHWVSALPKIHMEHLRTVLYWLLLPKQPSSVGEKLVNRKAFILHLEVWILCCGIHLSYDW